MRLQTSPSSQLAPRLGRMQSVGLALGVFLLSSPAVAGAQGLETPAPDSLIGAQSPRPPGAATATPTAVVSSTATPTTVVSAAAPAPLPRLFPAQTAAPLRYDLRVDLPITLVGLGAWVTTEALKSYLAPATCRWCGTNADGSAAVNAIDRGVRDGLRAQNSAPADLASSVLGFGVLPVAMIGLDVLAAGTDRVLRYSPVDILIVAESTVLAVDLNQLVKFSVGRERPFVAALPESDKGLTAAPADNNLSFYSGHTTMAFSLATAAGTVASLRRYRLAPLIWALGMTSATATGLLRIVADRHYFSDVLLGAVLGAGIGFSVPFLMHRPLLPGPAGGGSLLLQPTGTGGLGVLAAWRY